MKRWTEDELQILIKLYENTHINELVKILNRTKDAIHYKANVMGLKKSKVFLRDICELRNKSLFWPDDESERLKKYYAFKTTEELMGMFNRSAKSIYRHAFKLGLKKDPAYLKKKRKDTIDAIRAKYDSPIKIREIGSVSRTKSNQTIIKVQDGCGRENFKKAQHVLWEQHYGKVPKGYLLTFKDKNPLNIVIENLEIVTRAEIICRNSILNLPEDLRKTVYTLRKLNNIIKKHYEKQNQSS